MLYYLITTNKDKMISEHNVDVPILIDSTSITIDGTFRVTDSDVGDNNYILFDIDNLSYYLAVESNILHPVVVRFARKQYLNEAIVILTTLFNESDTDTSAIIGNGGYDNIDTGFVEIVLSGQDATNTSTFLSGIVDKGTYSTISVTSKQPHFIPYIDQQCTASIIRVETGENMLVGDVADLSQPGTYMVILGARITDSIPTLNIDSWHTEIFYVI